MAGNNPLTETTAYNTRSKMAAPTTSSASTSSTSCVVAASSAGSMLPAHLVMPPCLVIGCHMHNKRVVVVIVAIRFGYSRIETRVLKVN